MKDFKYVWRRSMILLVVAVLGGATGWGQTANRTIDEGPVHEAYVPPVTGGVLLDAIDREPPPPITERVPAQPSPECVWIPGYWTWAPTRGDFVWVSGVWRRPPPQRQWIAGYWKRFDEGWVWIRGFWSEVPADQLIYIKQAPPDEIEEEVSSPQDGDFFWAPGFWNYRRDEDRYVWVNGFWQRLDPNWVLVPPHYVWRPQGYVLVKAYWDWPIEIRGRAYENFYVDTTSAIPVVYEPVVVVEPEIIVRRVFVTYPDYVYFFRHHYRCHTTFWVSYVDTPPWWRWDSWWTLSWYNQWGIWWWYVSPGYPAPRWVDDRICRQLPPPRHDIVRRMPAPPIVSPHGIIKTGDVWRGKCSDRRGRDDGDFRPVIPANPDYRREIQSRVASRYEISPHQTELRPSGPRPPQMRDNEPRRPDLMTKPTFDSPRRSTTPSPFEPQNTPAPRDEQRREVREPASTPNTNPPIRPWQNRIPAETAPPTSPHPAPPPNTAPRQDVPRENAPPVRREFLPRSESIAPERSSPAEQRPRPDSPRWRAPETPAVTPESRPISPPSRPADSVTTRGVPEQGVSQPRRAAPEFPRRENPPPTPQQAVSPQVSPPPPPSPPELTYKSAPSFPRQTESASGETSVKPSLSPQKILESIPLPTGLQRRLDNPPPSQRQPSRQSASPSAAPTGVSSSPPPVPVAPPPTERERSDERDGQRERSPAPGSSSDASERPQSRGPSRGR